MNHARILLEREVPTGRDELHTLPRLLESIRDDCGISDDQFYNLVIAMTEALNNAMTHGNRLDPTKVVRYSLRCVPEGIRCIVEDEGEGFEMEEIPDPVAPENIMRLGGRGIYIMKALMQDVRGERIAGGMRVEFLCARA